MAELSPAALSILQAFDAAIDDGVRVGSERRGIAAALRALCREGHEHERTGHSLRYCAGGQCVRCCWEWNHGFRQVETERRLTNSVNF